MVRYELTKETEKYVHKLAEKVNSSLKCAELCKLEDHCRKRAVLIIRDPFKVNGQKYNNGFVSVHIKFNPKEPDFLNNEDHDLWYKKINEIAKKKFGIDRTFKFKDELDYATIDFEEPSEKELYALTKNKKETFKKGFDKVKKYIEWYNSSIKNYKEVINQHSEKMNEYLKGLETLVS